MPTEAEQSVVDYFDTPERSERLQLIVHLLNNAEDVPYLRGPSGSGKTRFAALLVDKTAEDYAVVWLDAGRVEAVRDAVAGELGLHAQQMAWPGEAVEATGDKLLLLVVDNADDLELQNIGALFELHEAGARLLFLGAGGLSHLQGDWDLQFVDLPPFSEEQSIEFLISRRADLTESLARSLHRAAGGLPGPLLNALSAMPEKAPKPPATAKETGTQRTGASMSVLLLTGAGVLILVLVLVFQDAINRLFEPAPVEPEPSAEVAAETVAPPARDVPEEVPEGPIVPEQLVHPIARQAQPEPLTAPQPEKAPESALSEVASISEPEPSLPSPVKSAEPPAEVQEEPDPILDAVIEAAIAAAEQPPATASESAEMMPESPQKPTQEKPTQVAEVTVPASPAIAPPAKPEPVAVSKPKATVKPPVSKAAQLKGLPWLLAQKPGDYTLQLVGARDQAALHKFIAQHQIPSPHAIFQRELNGKPWYSLVGGVYPDRDAAVAERAKLKPPLNRAGVWPRTFVSIQEQLKDTP